MPYFIIIVGPAGSGKSYLTAALSEWMEDQQLGVARINLDPAAEWLPYSPDIDVREYVDARKVMKEYNLGPNGALIASVDMLVNYSDNIREEVEAIKPNYIIVDSPGQLELFAFRSSGPAVLETIIGSDKSVTLFLVDASFTSTPSTYASMLMLSASVYMRLKKPQILVLTKIDLVPRSHVEKLVTWSENMFEFQEALISEARHDIQVSMLAQNLAEMLNNLGLSWSPIPTSSRTGEGLDNLYAEVQRILTGGEDFLTEEPSGRL
ncbi:MAG TPA: GTPase [Desulfurococcaceae archaeon]|nr:GTPase [Desulfurococcaceae archaeon]